jgi:hypothetical protein
MRNSHIHRREHCVAICASCDFRVLVISARLSESLGSQQEEGRTKKNEKRVSKHYFYYKGRDLNKFNILRPSLI